MPYKIAKKGKGFAVTSPNHPGGFAKKPQTKEKAAAQLRALYANANPKGEGGFSSLIKSR